MFALSGIGSLSHEKKANFWRDICDTFPSLIDFLCSPQQGLKQARSVGMLVDVWLLRCDLVSWQAELLAGLNR